MFFCLCSHLSFDPFLALLTAETVGGKLRRDNGQSENIQTCCYEKPNLWLHTCISQSVWPSGEKHCPPLVTSSLSHSCFHFHSFYLEANFLLPSSSPLLTIIWHLSFHPAAWSHSLVLQHGSKRRKRARERQKTKMTLWQNDTLWG